MATPSRSGAWPRCPWPSCGPGPRPSGSAGWSRRWRWPVAVPSPARRCRRPASPSTATTPRPCAPTTRPSSPGSTTAPPCATCAPLTPPTTRSWPRPWLRAERRDSPAHMTAGPEPMHVVATAGHVDHGKSTLVLALTGMDPDRFAEEKTRGLTIDLGFAWTALPSGRELALVDVPGHVRFIKNMLAGVGAVDACLFVVAATEGWKPQSEEHLRILELLGVAHGAVALTKVGLVDEEWAELARMDVAERVAGTFLEGAEVVAVDGVSGLGLDGLAAALDRLLEITPAAQDRQRPRLWVDRSFAAKGSGTVVTGTLTGGALDVDEELMLVPGHRGGRAQRVRVRALQSHQRPLPRVGPGHRVAVNLAGISHDRVQRGDALVRPGMWHATRTVDCSLTVLSSLDHEVSRRGAFNAYIGSGEHPVRLRLLGADALAPGEAGPARVHLPVALPLLPGDRYVLRESGRSETVGGGEVLDVDPVLPAAKAAPDRSWTRVVA